MANRLFFLLTVVVSVSHGQTKTFTDKIRGFEFSYPIDWTIDTLTSQVMVMAPKDDSPMKYPASFEVLSEQTQDSLDKCFKTHVTDWYPEQTMNFKINASGSRDLNGYKSKWIECQYQNASATYAKIIYMTVGKGRLFLIEGRTSSTKYSTFKGRFMEMINSFRLS